MQWCANSQSLRFRAKLYAGSGRPRPQRRKSSEEHVSGRDGHNHFSAGSVQKLAPDQQVANLTQIFGKEFGDDAQKLANNLPELRRQIELTQGAAAKGSMNRV